jgi:hypothetical protein
MKDFDTNQAAELLTDAMVMLLNIEKNRQMPPTAQTQSQYIALGKRIQEFLNDHKEDNLDPRDPDHSKPPPFDYQEKNYMHCFYNCWKCQDGTLPCPKGNPRLCENLHARDD